MWDSLTKNLNICLANGPYVQWTCGTSKTLWASLCQPGWHMWGQHWRWAGEPCHSWSPGCSKRLLFLFLGTPPNPDYRPFTFSCWNPPKEAQILCPDQLVWYFFSIAHFSTGLLKFNTQNSVSCPSLLCMSLFYLSWYSLFILGLENHKYISI